MPPRSVPKGLNSSARSPQRPSECRERFQDAESDQQTECADALMKHAQLQSGAKDCIGGGIVSFNEQVEVRCFAQRDPAVANAGKFDRLVQSPSMFLDPATAAKHADRLADRGEHRMHRTRGRVARDCRARC